MYVHVYRCIQKHIDVDKGRCMYSYVHLGVNLRIKWEVQNVFIHVLLVDTCSTYFCFVEIEVQVGTVLCHQPSRNKPCTPGHQ